MGTIEMAGNPAFGGAMARCEFCGTNVLPGVKLCSECRSALKRARNEPASVLQPLVKRAADTLERRDRRRAERREARAAEARAAGLVPPPVKKSRLAPWFIGALLVAVAVVAAAMWAFHGREGEPIPLSAPAAAGAADTATQPAVAPAAASSAAPAPDAATAVLPPPTTSTETAGAVPPAHPAEAHAAPKARRTLRVELPKPEAAPQRIAAPAPMAPIAAAPKLPVVAAPPDRRSLLRDAFAKCPQDEIVARAVCEQRARIEYCDGLWGAVPQCPAQRDYGG